MTKTQKNFIIALIIGVFIFFALPPVKGLTPTGVKMLAVFIPVVYIWLAEGGSGWSSLLAVTALVMLGVYDGALAYQMLWGGAMVAMIIPYYMMANALEESGAIRWVVRWILSRKITHGRPTVFTILFVVAIVISSIFITPIVNIVIFFKILTELTESVGIDRDSKLFRAHGLLIGWIGQIADGCLIWGRPFILAMVGIITGFGFERFTMNDFFKISAIFLVIACAVGILIVKFWIRPDTTLFAQIDDAAIREELKANPMPKRAKILLCGMVVVIIAYVAAFLTPLGAMQIYFNGLPIAAPISLVVALMALIIVDQEPVMDIGKQAAKLPWNTILFLGSVMFFSGIIGSSEFGISEMLGNLIAPIVSNLSSTMAVFIGLVIASILTNLTSNAVSCMVVLSCFVPAMLVAPNISNSTVLAFSVCVVTVCATAIATRAACAGMSVVYCPEGIEYKGTAKYSIAVCAIMVLVSTFILVPLGSNIFAGLV